MVMEIFEITPDLVGKEISCIIGGTEIPSAEIYFSGNKYFIMNDYKNGYWEEVVKKSGTNYKYGWSVSSGSESYLKTNTVSNIKLITNEPTYEIY